MTEDIAGWRKLAEKELKGRDPDSLTWDTLGPAWTFTLAAGSAALAWGVYAAWGQTKSVPAPH